MKKLIQYQAVAGIFLLSFLFTACDSSSNEGSPRVHISLTDAPRAEMVSAFVSIDRVEIQSSDSSWTTLTQLPQEFDLLSLQNDSSIVIVDTTLADGVYNQLRLIVGDGAEVEYDDGSFESLTVPSGTQTGIKILLHNVDLSSDMDTLSLFLDFDASNSFVEGGQSGLLAFKPVIKVLKGEKSGQNLGLDLD